ncbi:uncharacterized protein LOC109849309 [Asparagus officinalis]|nr:uncharacterized protein LOC109849309 [Asparagus officinalis]
MKGNRAVIIAVLFLAAQMAHVMPSPTTAPAFLWSPHKFGSSPSDVKEFVDYRTLSPADLVKSVLSEGGWSDLVCSGKNLQPNVDVALVYVGRKLQSSDLSKAEHTDPILLSLLKNSFSSSNTSVAFPYVAVSDGKNALENSLISGFVENCGSRLGVDHIAYMESCSIEGENLKKLRGVQSLEDFVGSRMETRIGEKTDLIVVCDEGSQDLDQGQSEGKTLSSLVNFLEKSGATYTVLYASDPSRSVQYPHLVMRFLAEDNVSTNVTLCDGVCQLKSSLLEGLFVAITLLIILISGLCCMMGIDTPTRFEAPPES